MISKDYTAVGKGSLITEVQKKHGGCTTEKAVTMKGIKQWAK